MLFLRADFGNCSQALAQDEKVRSRPRRQSPPGKTLPLTAFTREQLQQAINNSGNDRVALVEIWRRS